MIDTAAPADRPPMMWGRSSYKHSGQFLGTGNRCGHDPTKADLDRLALPQTNNGYLLKMQQLLIDRAQQYFHTPQKLTILSNLSRKVNRDGTPRQNRSEGREAQCLVLSAILSMTDFCSLRVGIPMANGTFKPRTMEEIAKASGLMRAIKPTAEVPNPDPLPSKRFWRAISQLKRAAAIEIFEQYEETEDGKRARPAIKTVSENFLIALGRISFAAFKEFRDTCSRKLRNFRNKWRKAAPGEFDAVKAAELVRREQALMGGRTRKPRKNQTPKLPDVDRRTQMLRDHAAHMAEVAAKVEDHIAIHGKLSLRERLELQNRFGLMTWDQWQSRQPE